MRFEPIRMQFYETYHYANIVHNVLTDPSPYIRNLHSWHEDREIDLFLTPFQKHSVLHDFCWYVINSLIDERMEEDARQWPVSKLWIDEAMKFHGIASEGFRAWHKGMIGADTSADANDLYEYHSELWFSGELEALLEQLSGEVFQILFSNRELLFRLNYYISASVSRITVDELPSENRNALTKDGVPARASIPEWVKRAVFHRDRGLCTNCNSDMSGLVSLAQSKHFDHVVPLAQGGINDVTNIQLLCAECNLEKGPELTTISNRYQPWHR